MKQIEQIVLKVRDTLILASSSFRKDQKQAYMSSINKETFPRAKWILETVLENAEVAEKNQGPLCDDTGIPHLFLEVGPNKVVTGEIIEAIHEGIRQGLRELPGRPMAIKGNDLQRLDQSGGLDEDSGALAPAPILIKPTKEDVLRLHILMLGGGPAIRGITYRVFHKHSTKVVADEIVSRASEATALLGCTPCTLAIGIGRSQFEASSLMLEAMVFGKYGMQTELEQYITDNVNKINVGPLGLGGDTTVLATFMRVGPQRASGVRIVSLRPCCCFEPRVSSVLL
jgi:fumarate hydratase subunit alpha